MDNHEDQRFFIGKTLSDIGSIEHHPVHDAIYFPGDSCNRATMKDALLMNRKSFGPKTFRLHSHFSRKTFADGLTTQPSMNSLKFLPKDTQTVTTEQLLQQAATSATIRDYPQIFDFERG